MGCQCYQIDGPFIDADPNCALHGTEAMEREERADDIEARLSRLEKENEELKQKVKRLEAKVFRSRKK